MPISATLNTTPSPLRVPSLHHHPTTIPSPFLSPPSLFLAPQKLSLSLTHNPHRHLFIAFSANAASTNSEANAKFAGSGGSGGDGRNNGSGGGGGSGDGNEGSDDSNKNNNKEEALMALAKAGRSLESLPKDLKAAIEEGRIPGSILLRYLDLEKSDFLSWLMKFGGFKERLLADDLFLAKVAMECGVGVFTKTAAEYERRRENFFKEIEIVFADVASVKEDVLMRWFYEKAQKVLSQGLSLLNAFKGTILLTSRSEIGIVLSLNICEQVMAIIADFMLVYLPAPTVSLRPPLALNAGRLVKFFHGCPDNAFQVALRGSSFSLLQRIGAIVRNGAKLFAVGTTSSLVGTVVTNALINARKAVDHVAGDEVENVPVLSTSVAYGVYMAVSSNLRYQVLAGVIEQRLLEPLLHQHKLFLSAICFAVRTGNTFLGSLLWVDYARFIGIQKAQEVE